MSFSFLGSLSCFVRSAEGPEGAYDKVAAGERD